MSKKAKLLERLFSKPTDFTWEELKTLLSGFGYKEIRGRGSRIKFYNAESNSLINLHKPHPSNILKSYMVNDVTTQLEEKGIHP
ncbi:MAG: type II toxin-antitoxin system HicA family toxin [Nitrospirae bacterium]|nr:type II toxin-antitoxin system HicA family toxin [Nitrospirota bacterium]